MEVSEAEWKTRVDLAALYRLTALYHWDDLVFTHISMRVPGPGHNFLINPYGFLFEEITASSLVKVDLAGNIVMETPYFINPAGFIIHSTVHEAREDATQPPDMLRSHAADEPGPRLIRVFSGQASLRPGPPLELVVVGLREHRRVGRTLRVLVGLRLPP